MKLSFVCFLICIQGFTCSKIQELSFSKEFSFGVATSAYQIEGAWNESGKGLSIWDYISHNTEDIVDGATADIACDSYHKIDDDIQLLTALGVNHYRFSIAWTRILPSGLKNKINWDGVRYYDYLISKLLENEIEPWVTIYHFDHPYTLELIGGWFQEKMGNYLADYADLLFSLFGERVKTWITINEPWNICVSGMAILGSLRPNGTAEYLCGLNILRAHAAVWDVFNKKYKTSQNGKLSMAFSFPAYLPATNAAEDVEATERVKQFVFGWFVHPIIFGNYPKEMIDVINYYSEKQGFSESRLPQLSVIELLKLRGSYDFIGLNNYDTYLVSANNKSIDKSPSYDNDVGATIITDPGWNTSYSIHMKAKGLGVILKWIKDNYNNPEIRITEQGLPDTTGSLIDYERHSYLVENMAQLLQSIHEDKVNVTGYTFWSLMDNFEWSKGYSVKYGINYVNFSDPTRPRRAKLSALTYSLVLKNRSVFP